MKKLPPKKFKKSANKVQIASEKRFVLSKNQFPTFSRFITEAKKILKHWKTKQFWVVVISGTLLLLIIVELGKGYELFSKRKQVEIDRQKILLEIEFWNKIIQDYKGFKDAYYRIALLRYQLGNKQAAKLYIEKALSIDPFFEDARRLKKLL